MLVLHEAVLLLRNDIFNVQPQKMSDDIKVKHLLDREFDTG